MERELLEALRAELSEERGRKSSLESRGLTLAAAASASVALLFGLGSQYTGRWQFVFYLILLLGGLAFVGSAVTGWFASRALSYKEVDPKEFDTILEQGWDGDVDQFRAFLAEGALTVLRASREMNDQKARAFDWALRLLLLGAGAVGGELFLVFLDRIL